MSLRLIWPAALLLLVSFGLGCQEPTDAASSAAVEEENPDFEILIFTKTDGWRHESIPRGIAAIWELAEEHGFSATATENTAFFSEERLEEYDAVVFLNTTQTVFEDQHRDAFQAYIQKGGGFVGVHAAADTEYDWPWFGELVGGYFDGHPPVQEADIHVVDPEHPSTEHLPDVWTHTDEWYSYRDMYDGINVLLNLDEDTYDLGDTPSMGSDHHVAWYHEYDGGRSWYTGLGHTVEAYEDDNFRQHLLMGIYWAAGAK